MQTRVTIFPDLPDDWSWSPPLHHYWRKAAARDQLIPLSLAIDYFRKPTVYIDARVHPPILADREPL
jgi:hypothetical protein